MEHENISANNGEQVAETHTEIEQTQTDVQETSATSELAEPNLVQDAETNARYAEQRRKQELDEYRTKADTYSSKLERAAKYHGFSNVADYEQALDQAEQEQRIAQEAQKAGMDEEAYRQYLAPVNEKLKSYEQEIQQLKSADVRRQYDTEASMLKAKDPNFTNYEAQAKDAWIKYPFETLADAYAFVAHKDQVAKVKQTTEQETIRKLQQNGSTSAGSLSDGGVNHNTSISNMPKNDFNSLVERVLRGDQKQL